MLYSRQTESPLVAPNPKGALLSWRESHGAPTCLYSAVYTNPQLPSDAALLFRRFPSISSIGWLGRTDRHPPTIISHPHTLVQRHDMYFPGVIEFFIFNKKSFANPALNSKLELLRIITLYTLWFSPNHIALCHRGLACSSHRLFRVQVLHSACTIGGPSLFGSPVLFKITQMGPT